MLRSYLFQAWLYGSMALIAVVGSPALLMSSDAAIAVTRFWARTALFGLRVICGVRVQVRGAEGLGGGEPLLIACKHQSMLDVIVPFTFLPRPCFVMKAELMRLPFIGWYSKRAGGISVERDAYATALKAMVRTARERLAEGRQIFIFPEGTRQAPGAAPDYKSGVAALYRDLEVGCQPIAAASGLCWPAHGVRMTPGLVVFEALEPIPAGLKRAEFMATLESRIETATAALIAASGRG